MITRTDDRPGEAAAAAKEADGRRRLVLVTGMSGAGKTSALKVFEDLGYEVVDNLPVSLLASVVRPPEPGNRLRQPLALCVDVRTRHFDIEHFEHDIAPLLSSADLDVTLLFLDCDNEILRRRFTETRRRHPLASDRPVIDGIRHERDRLAWLRNRADLAIDTSGVDLRDLRRLLNGHFSYAANHRLGVFVMSFSYRQGLPPEADLVFDVRFLVNPHYDPALRPLSGRDAVVAAYIERDSAFQPFLANLTGMLVSLLPAYEREGKSYLTIAVGCTGGRHRSVFVAERIAAALRGAGCQVGLRHRDIDRLRESERRADGAERSAPAD